MEKEVVNHSIFKKKYLANKYEASKYYLKIRASHYDDAKILKEETFECNMSMPLLSVGDEFYIEEENKIITINKVIRTSKDNVLYIVEPEWLDDEDTIKKEKEQAEIVLKEYIKLDKNSKEEENKNYYLKMCKRYRLLHRYNKYINYHDLYWDK